MAREDLFGSGRSKRGTRSPRCPGMAQHVFAVAFLPDGRRILSAGDDSKLRLWDLVIGRQIRSFDHEHGNVYALALSADGAVAISGGEDLNLRIWNVESGRLLRNSPVFHKEPINRVAFVRAGPTVLTASDEGQIGAWNLGQNRRLNHRWRNVQWKALAASPDGHTVAFGGTGTDVVWTDLHDRAVMNPLPGFPQARTRQDTERDVMEKRTPGSAADGRPACLRLAGAVTDLAVGGGGRTFCWRWAAQGARGLRCERCGCGEDLAPGGRGGALGRGCDEGGHRLSGPGIPPSHRSRQAGTGRPRSDSRERPGHGSRDGLRLGRADPGGVVASLPARAQHPSLFQSHQPRHVQGP